MFTIQRIPCRLHGGYQRNIFSPGSTVPQFPSVNMIHNIMCNFVCTFLWGAHGYCTFCYWYP